jgi:hypothetical protein
MFQEVLSEWGSRNKALSYGRASIYKLTERVDNWGDSAMVLVTR